MASRAISRLLLILALIVAAHAFKPISSRSVIEQLLSAAESLSFVLPDFAEVRIAQASYLAAAFSQGSEQRDETTSRFAETMGVASRPAVLAFGQSVNSNAPRTPCEQSEVAPTLAKAGPVRALVARAQPRVQARVQARMLARLRRITPDLPEALPLSRALAMTLPLAEVELRLMPMPRLSERQVLRRALFMPVTIKPMLPVRKQTKADCDATIIVASESGPELSQNAGQREEEFDLEIWDFDVPAETVEGAETEPGTSPAPRNCQVTLPEMIIPPQPLEVAPKQ